MSRLDLRPRHLGLWALCALSGLIGCDAKPTRPRTLPPPDSQALRVSWDPVWLSENRVAYNHRPLRSVSYEPATGHVRYDWDDSSSGWWSVSATGDDPRMLAATYLSEPARNSQGSELLWMGRVDGRGSVAVVSPLTTDSIHLSASSVVTTASEVTFPRWNGSGDSIVYHSPTGGGTWIVSRSGTATRKLDTVLLWPDWHPTLAKILFVRVPTSTTTRTYALEEYDLVKGVTRTLLEHDNEIMRPRYSPDGRRIAYVRLDASNGGAFALMVCDSAGRDSRILASPVDGGCFNWSPSGSDIAFLQHSFTTYARANSTIWRVRVSDGAATRLTMN